MTRVLPPLLARGLAVLTDLVVPLSCAGCGARAAAACPACVAMLRGPVILAAAGPLATPRRRGLPPCLAVARYGGPVRSLVLAYKERGRVDLARPLGSALARVLELAAVGDRVDAGVARAPAGLVRRGPTLAIVPVPSTSAARRRRGFDHVGLLCSVAAAVLRRRGHRVRVTPMLRPVRRMADQAGLGAAARAANLDGAFALRDPRRCAALLDTLGHTRVVIVDDVLTTGATVGEAVRCLAAVAIRPTAAVVVAATDPTRGRHGLPAIDVPSG
ncbi:ComF family protein [Frankia sp. AgB32]|uniref:ComF family protein n=1 Tax=Frankia sp. AgB32 TaxID=631119 RepID=UPI00200E36BF|nr:ComF family protein [Frankia sp. AgB32]MCK9893785.1 ComF family protein [Frankia sp. AgB32]